MCACICMWGCVWVYANSYLPSLPLVHLPHPPPPFSFLLFVVVVSFPRCYFPFIFSVFSWSTSVSSFVFLCINIVGDHFCIALFTTLQQTHCTLVCNSKWMTVAFYSFIFIFNIHLSSATMLLGYFMTCATWNCCNLGAHSVHIIQPCTSLQCYFIPSHIHRVHMCLAVHKTILPGSEKSDQKVTDTSMP